MENPHFQPYASITCAVFPASRADALAGGPKFQNSISNSNLNFKTTSNPSSGRPSTNPTSSKCHDNLLLPACRPEATARRTVRVMMATVRITTATAPAMRTSLPTILRGIYISSKAITTDLGLDMIITMISEALRDTIIMIGNMMRMCRALNHIGALIRTVLVMRDSLFDKNHLLISTSTTVETQIIDPDPGLPSANHTAKPMATMLAIAILCATVAIMAHIDPSVVDEVDILVARQRIAHF